MPIESRQVMCINKRDRFNEHERIQNIGGVLPPRVTTLLTATAPKPLPLAWKMNEDEAILQINAGRMSFYTLVQGVRAEVKVAYHRSTGRPYLTTHPDDIRKNNLLYLPECP